MKKIEQHKYILMFTVIGLLISPLLYFGFRRTVKLTDFEIRDFNQNINDIDSYKKLSWSPSKNVYTYKIVIYNENLKILNVHNTKETSMYIDNQNIDYNKNIFVNIKAIDINGNTKEVTTSDYKIKWKSPTIKIKNNSNITNNKEFKFSISHNKKIKLDNYYFILSQNNNTIYKEKINNSTGLIPKEIMHMLIGKYELKLCTKINNLEQVINSKKININVPKISDIEITEPNSKAIPWDDFTIKFKGGENAVKYYINLNSEDKKVIFEQHEINNKKLDILIDDLEENKTYNLEVIALNPMDSSVKKSEKIKFRTGQKEQVKTVESNTPSGNISWNRKISLSTQTKNAEIFYTTDGTNPTTNSNLYKEPIKITSKTTIKAIAVKKNMYDSDIIEFKYNPVKYGMGSSNSWAPISLYNEGFLPVRYYNQRTGGFSTKTYGPENNDWNDGKIATIASHGCGPTALAIVVSTLTEKDVDPAKITDYACSNGYCFESGTVNSFIKHYAKKQGLNVTQVNKSDKEKIISALKTKKSLVIAIMGEGDFTNSAHYIVLRGVTNDGKVLVADPNSLEKSKRFWSLNKIIEQSKEPYFFIISK